MNENVTFSKCCVVREIQSTHTEKQRVIETIHVDDDCEGSSFLSAICFSVLFSFDCFGLLTDFQLFLLQFTFELHLPCCV
jgi:hypothetical protein